MYALIHKERVLVGPMKWNRGLLDAALQKTDVSGHVPRIAPSPENLPLVFDEETKIMPAKYETPPMNEKIERTYGPFWTFDNDVAVGTYKIKDKEIDTVRSELKNVAASERYTKEIAGTTTTIQETEISLDTSREGRNVFVQKYMMMGDDETVNWKFPEGWLTINKVELGQIVQAGAAHIQAQFDWEVGINTQIDEATTLEELDAIVIIEPEEEEIDPALNPDGV